MTNEQMELLFKFQAQGVDQLQKLVDGITKVNAGAVAGSPAIDKLEKEVQGLGAAMSGAGKQAQATGSDFAGLASKIQSGVIDPMGAARQSAIGFLETLGKGPAVAAGVVLALGAAGKVMFDLVAGAGAAAEEVLNLADRLGITAGQAERLKVQAGIAGVNIGSLEGASRLLASALEDQSGAGEKTASALRKMGVSVNSASGEQREMGVVLLEVLGALSKIPNDAERALAAQQTLGRGAAKELQPLIKSYADLQAATAQLGIGLDDSLTKRLAAADDEIGKLTASWEKFKKQVAGQAAPIIIPIVVKLTGILAGSKTFEFDATKPGGLAEAFSNIKPGSAASFDSKQSFLDSTVGYADRQSLASGFRAGQGSTEEGRKRRLQQIQRESAELSSKLSSGDLDAGAFRDSQATLAKLEAEGAKIEAAIKAAGDRKSLLSKLADMERQARKAGLTELQKLNADAAELLKELGPGYAAQVARIYGPQQFAAIQKVVHDGRAAVSKEGQAVADANLKAIEFENKRFVDGLKKSADDLEKGLRDTQARLKVFYGADASRLEREANFAVSVGKATAGPGAQISGIEQSFAIRKKLAEDLYALSVKQAEAETDAATQSLELLKAKAEFEKSTDEARKSRELDILELRKKGLEDYRNAAGSVWDALKRDGGGGFADFITGQLDVLQRQLFVNFSGKLFQKGGGLLGKLGAASGLPADLLAGTILDPQNAGIDKATDDNTRETRENTKAIRGLSRTLSGVGAAGGFGLPLDTPVPGLPGLSLGDFVSDGNGITGQGGFLGKLGLGKKLFGESTLSTLGALAGGFGGVFSGGGFAGLRASTSSTVYDENGTATTFNTPKSTASRVGAGLGIASAVGAGAFGVYSGIKEGGGRGAVTAIGSAAGAAAALSPEPISKAILTAIALGASLFKGLLGDPKKEYSDAQDRLLKDRAYKAPDAMDRFLDVGTGQDVEYDYRGRMRLQNRQPVVQVNIQAIDTKSILDRSADIGSAVLKEINLGNPTGLGIQQAVLGT
jgi:hypothetical protein